MAHRTRVGAGLVALAVLTGCAATDRHDGESESSEADGDRHELSVTFEGPADAERTGCGFDDYAIALEDASGALLVPAVRMSDEPPVDELYVSGGSTWPKTCRGTSVLTEVPDHEVYQLVWVTLEDSYRAGYRRSHFDAEGWHLRDHARTIFNLW